MRSILAIICIVAILLGASSCGNAVSTGAHFRETYKVDVNLPEGWAAVEGPYFMVFGRVESLISYNSWGQDDFKPQAIDEYNSDNSIKSTGLNAGDLYSMIPRGGAYIVLEEMDVPPFVGKGPAEYSPNDLSGLYQPHDWRQDSSNFGYTKDFFKAGSQLRLVVVCNYFATDETVARINDLLQSWKFVNIPTGGN